MDNNVKESIYGLHFVELKSAAIVREKLDLNKQEFTKLTIEISEERADEIKEMKRIRQLYNNKQGTDFKFDSFKEFFQWYLKQHKKQEGCCYYCKTEEKVIAEVFREKYKFAKRQNRGRHLEVERRDAKSNEYRKDNCVLACYFCNNDKSDIFTEEEYFEYLKGRKSFFEKQLKLLK